MNKTLNAHIFERATDEWYVEPVWCSDALFRLEDFEGGVWDPACGQGNIVEAAIKHKYAVEASDIVLRAGISRLAHPSGRRDFFECSSLYAPNIVTNPPSLLAEIFIRHAISLKPQKLAVFVDSRFLFGRARAEGLFAEFPPARIWLITPRPSCPPGAYLEAGNKAGGGRAEYCWIVWTPRAFSYLSHSATLSGWLRCTPR